MTITHTFEVCTDCLLASEGYTVEETGSTPDREPLNLWPGACLAIACEDDCECLFSWSPCEGCGSTLGGDRHLMAAFDYLTPEDVQSLTPEHRAEYIRSHY